MLFKSSFSLVCEWCGTERSLLDTSNACSRCNNHDTEMRILPEQAVEVAAHLGALLTCFGHDEAARRVVDITTQAMEFIKTNNEVSDTH